MKRIILAIMAVLAFAGSAMAQDVYVNGYTRRDGTYVQPYHRTAPNDNYYDNYSSKGNYNPYTGQAGTVTYDQYQNQRSKNNDNNYVGGLYGR